MRAFSIVAAGTSVVALGVIAYTQINNIDSTSLTGALNMSAPNSVSSSVCGKVYDVVLDGPSCGGACGTPGWQCQSRPDRDGIPQCICVDPKVTECYGGVGRTCGGTCPNPSETCTSENYDGPYKALCVCRDPCEVGEYSGMTYCVPLPKDAKEGESCDMSGTKLCKKREGNKCSTVPVFIKCQPGLRCSNNTGLGFCQSMY